MSQNLRGFLRATDVQNLDGIRKARRDGNRALEGGDAQPGRASVSSYQQTIERGHRQGGNRVHGAMVVARVESLVEPQAGRDEIARAAGVGAVEDLAHRSLEECDQLAQDVSVHARQGDYRVDCGGCGGDCRCGPVHSRSFGRRDPAIRRIGHCYGYPLTTERDRHYVMGVLELATAEEPEVRQSIRARLYLLMHDPKMAPLELHGVRRALAEDLAIEALPVLGEVAAVVLDYAFMRRVTTLRRRVFQERWLRRRGKVLVIPPAEAGFRSQSLTVAWEASLEVLYLGSFGLGFVATLPVAAAAMVLKRSLPEPAFRGATDGGRDAVASVDRLREGVGAVARPPALAAILTSPHVDRSCGDCCVQPSNPSTTGQFVTTFHRASRPCNGLTGQLVGACTRRVPGSSGTNSFMPSITTRTRNKPISGQ